MNWLTAKVTQDDEQEEIDLHQFAQQNQQQHEESKTPVDVGEQQVSGSVKPSALQTAENEAASKYSSVGQPIMKDDVDEQQFEREEKELMANN